METTVEMTVETKPSLSDFRYLAKQILAGNASATVHHADGSTVSMDAEFVITTTPAAAPSCALCETFGRRCCRLHNGMTAKAVR